MSFGEQLRSHRIASGLTQAELAERAGLTVSAVGALERGERRHPYPYTARTLAAALSLTDAAKAEFFAAAQHPASTSTSDSASPRLPGYLTALVGREAEEAVALGLLRRPEVRLLTLTGPGGVGKTRLAVQTATDVAAYFPDGMIFVPLAPLRDPALVLATIAHAAGAPEATGHALLANLIGALSTRHTLLVLDNFEHLTAAAPQVTALLLACPFVKAMVTSRARLRVTGEQEYRVPPLELPSVTPIATGDAEARVPAVALFVARAQEADPAFIFTSANAPIVARICHQLDGLPLALELAAARVASLPLPVLLARLDRSLQVLTGGPRDAPARQRTMREAIAWSHDLLAPTEQALFRRLAVFAGGFTLDAAEAVAAGPIGTDSVSLTPSVIVDAITTLIDQSLLRILPDAPGGPRYGMLETIRGYAVERLATDDVAPSLRQRHAGFYLSWAEAARPELTRAAAQMWFDRFEAEHDNLRAALDWLAQSGDWGACLRLVAALSPFWDYHGHLSEGRAWLERALDPTLTGGAPSNVRADALAAFGLLAARQGDFDRADAALEAARAIWLQLGDHVGLARALLWLGGVAEYCGDEARAQARFDETLALFRERGDPAGETETIYYLADTAYRRGDFVQAATLAQQVVAGSREGELPLFLVAGLVTAGESFCALGDGRRAAEALCEALDLARDLGSRLWVADALVGLADVATSTGDATHGARLLGAADALADRLGVPLLPHHALHRRAHAATREALGEPEFAVAWAAGKTHSLDEAVAEARTVTGAPPALRSDLFTPREREVLRLLVAGRTDREIAEALFVGTRTVEGHVAHILAKLNVRTRRAAAVALAAGLVAPPREEP